MELADIAVRVRPRTSYEALDLGFALARQWYGALITLWLIPALPVMFISFFVFYQQPWWALLIVWWLKPLFESVQLKFLSEKLFQPELRWTHWLPNLHKTLFKHGIAKLTWRRLAPARSFDMAVSELEGLSGKGRRRRLQALHQNGNGAGICLTLLGHTIEGTLILALFAAGWMLIPMEMSIDFDLFQLLEHPLLFPAITLFGFLAMALISPFYVAGGFMLYLNRRVWLEAWDVELVFRKMASTTVTLACCLLLLHIFTPSLAFAVTAEESREQIIHIVEGEDFHQYEEVTAWRLKNRESGWLGSLVDWMKSVLETWQQSKSKSPVAGVILDVLEAILWIIVVGLIVLAVYRLRHLALPAIRSPRPRIHEKPSHLFGLEMNEQAFNEQVLIEARQLWQQGHVRQALGQLYRGALSFLLLERDLPLHSSQTEEECLRVCASQESDARYRYFRTLTRHWINLAYAHRSLSAEEFNQLCEDWPEFRQNGAKE